MAKYFMFGRYSAQAINNIAADRTEKAAEIIKKHGGKVKKMYALLGEMDLVLIVDMPGATEVAKASIALSRLTGIGFSTAEAIPIEDFDKLAAEA